MIVAIDGPAGSGKSTVAKLAAERLGFAYLDTGAMYRAVAWRALELGIALDDEPALTAIATNEPISFGYLKGEPLPSEVYINDIDVTREIRTPATDLAVSPVSAVLGVREALVAQQQRIGMLQDTVMEGRDIGTAVFPGAELKVFLTARPEVRAERRLCQNAERFGKEASSMDREAILADIIRRDTYDSSREHSPLVAADDALVLDTSDMSISEVVDWIVNHAAA
ncbi:MAG: (d)CMP kinase [Coriobacteriia bacterium]|nr:(d)CMP kinase [Coriobacteriia bacterium]MCL2749617.1 (d)CMP kinase [Coriobacteriia bacterium]